MKRKLGTRFALAGLAFVAVMVITSSAADACGFVRGRGALCYTPCPQRVVIIDRSDRFFVRSFPSQRAIVVDRSAFGRPVFAGRLTSPIAGRAVSPVATPPPMFTR
jgi:hypothetical protein